MLQPTGGSDTDVEVDWYRPFARENLGLYRILGELPQTQEAVLDFANDYGMLGWPLTRGIWGGEPTGSTLAPPQVFDALGWPSRSLALENSATPHIGEFFRDEKRTQEKGSPPGHSWLGQIGRFAEVLLHRELLHPKTAPLAGSIQTTINFALKDATSPYLSWSAEQQVFTLRLRPHSLLGALWLQAALAVAEAKEFRECPVCGRPIEISTSGGARADAVFCSNACKSKDYRQRRSEARKLAKKMSPAAIAKQLRTDAKTVRGWLK